MTKETIPGAEGAPGRSGRLVTIVTGAGSLIAAAIALQAIYVAYFGAWDITYGRPWILCAAVILAIITHPLANRTAGHGLLRAAAVIADLALAAVAVAATLRFIEIQVLLEETLFEFETSDTWIALAGVLVVLEVTRRLFGLPIVIIAAGGILYCLYGSDLPGFLSHSDYTLNQLMQTVWYGFQGVFGLPMGVVLQVVLIFIVFGVALEGTGASDALIRVSTALTGGTRGGPAHAAVVASGLFGSMSGSVTANVVGTGTFTIPMIRRRGFSGATAGGIEAAASTGGQIVPPVMGAAAFLMADLTGEFYTTICLAALVPALFYYGSLFSAISIQAGAQGIEPIPPHERPVLSRRDLAACALFVVPILTIIVVLVLGRSPAAAGLWATLITLGLSQFNPAMRGNLRALREIAVKAGRACTSIIIAVACIGVILGVLNVTGLGISFASTVAEYSRVSLMVALLVTALACLALGMGMPTLPAYLIIVLVLGPVLKELGAQTLAAHMFVFYFGVLSAITPPVAIGAFAAAPIAQAHPLQTAVVAVRLALIGFIVPFVFVYEPALLLVGGFEPLTFARVAIGLALAIWLLNTALIGFDRGRLGLPSRVLRVAVGALCVIQWPLLQIPGIAVAIVFAIIRWVRVRRARSAGAVNPGAA